METPPMLQRIEPQASPHQWWKVALGYTGWLAAIAMAGWIARTPTIHTPPPPRDLSDIEIDKIQTDLTLCVPPKLWRARLIQLRDDEYVYIEVQRVRNANDGFTVYLFPVKEFFKFRDGQPAEAEWALDGVRTTNIAQFLELKEGLYYLVVENTENKLTSLEAHVRITIDPR